jgi:hypothetical protein
MEKYGNYTYVRRIIHNEGVWNRRLRKIFLPKVEEAA